MSKRCCSSALSVVAVVAAASAAAIVAYRNVIRPWRRQWGALPSEVAQPLPGDDLVADPVVNVTHAVAIAAPADRVWPWLVQLGQGRGGFYSYEFIENAMGADIHNVRRIVPELQDLKVGDTIPLSQDGFGIPVAILEPGRTLVLHGDSRLGGEGGPKMKPGDFINVSWGFYLFPEGENTCRLVERWRAGWNRSRANDLVWGFFTEAGAFIMQRKMLLSIKELAEQA